MSVCLVTVVSGEAYARYAKQLGESADEFFHPAKKTGFLILDGREGWPAATLYRYHVLLENERHLRDFDYVYLVDADMRFEAPVGEEVLGRTVATLHPGYVGVAAAKLPYERRRDSHACVANGRGGVYYCGGFVGGEWDAFRALATVVRGQIELDDYRGLTAVWHDESHLNAALALRPPALVLSPSYCYPDDDSWYLKQWKQPYERRLVALDKTSDERRGR